MSSIWKPILLVLTLLLAGCDALNPSPEAVITKEGGDPPLEQTGKALYERACANCHGLDGISITPDMTQMKGWHTLPYATFGYFDTTLSSGPGSMPIFDTLTTEARMKIYEYIKGL